MKLLGWLIGAVLLTVGLADDASAQRYYDRDYNWVSQSWSSPGARSYRQRNRSWRNRSNTNRGRKGPDVMSGGGRPRIAAKRPPVVGFRKKFKRGSIVIDTSKRRLYYVLGKGRAYQYPIAVGKRG
ncbi:MAG: L,D-transpeptidase, partial [Pseudomonadota bacterium]